MNESIRWRDERIELLETERRRLRRENARQASELSRLARENARLHRDVARPARPYSITRRVEC